MISAARLAWLQLRRQKVRLLVAVAGVGFAVVLMLMQIGFRDALFRSAVNVHERMRGDLVMISPHYNFIIFPASFPRRRLYQTLAFDGVAAATALYASPARWKNPVTGRKRDIFAIGVDPARDALDIPELTARRAELRYPDVVFFDELSRPEFGPVAAALRAGETVETEVAQRRVMVRGLFALGTSFGIDGTIVTSDLNFLRMFPFRAPGSVSIGLVRVVPGADPLAVRDALTAALPRDVEVLTRKQFMDREVDYWNATTPIGYVFNLGVVMGVIVGAIIVYQILFADISDHLAEYATLKAMGYPNRYLAGVVLMEALILAAIGYLPGVATASWLYRITASATKLPMQLSVGRGGQILALTVVMCWASALIAMRKLRAADPADVF